jgi:methyl-accepting chemotaxis protein
MVNILNLNSRLKIGTRVGAGFGFVLLLLVGLAVTAYLGLNATLDAFSNYARVSANTVDTVQLDRDFASLRRNAMAYATNGGDDLIAVVNTLRTKVHDEMTAVLAATDDPARRDKVVQIGDLVHQFTANQDTMIEKKKVRDKLLFDQLYPFGEKLKTLLDDGRKAAVAENDIATVAQIGVALESLMTARLFSNRYVAAPDPKLAATAQENIDAMAAVITALKQSAKGSEQQDRLHQADDLLQQYKSAFTTATAAVDVLDKIVNVTNAKLADDITKGLTDIRTDKEARLKERDAQARAGIASTINWTFSLAIAATLLGCLLAWLIGRGIVRPVTAMTKAMTVLAQGNTSAEIPARDNTDEIGTMARAVQVFKDNMIETEKLRREQEEQKKRAETERRQAMRDLADKFEKRVGGVVNAVSSAATELQSTAESMSSTAEETTRQSTAVAAASEEATTNVQTVASATEELNASVKEIAQQIGESTRIVAEAVSQANDTNARVQSLRSAVDKIGDVISLINDIASQTNLLALNATIEAARAGEAGKGFAVVASEVKALANQTAKATEEIGSQIKSIQDETKISVESIESITATIGKVSAIASTIAAAVEEQEATTHEIARSVAQAAQGTSEVTSNIGGVSQASQQTGAAATQVLGSARELSQSGETLKSQVDSFLREVRAA